jgi:hypothetical protein
VSLGKKKLGKFARLMAFSLFSRGFREVFLRFTCICAYSGERWDSVVTNSIYTLFTIYYSLFVVSLEIQRGNSVDCEKKAQKQGRDSR